MIAQRLRDRAEDDAGLGELVLEGGDHRYRIEHRIDRDIAGAVDAGLLVERALVVLAATPRQDLLLLERNAESLIGPKQLRIDVRLALRAARTLGRGVIIDVVEVDLRIVDPGPGRLFHLQ